MNAVAVYGTMYSCRYADSVLGSGHFNHSPTTSLELKTLLTQSRECVEVGREGIQRDSVREHSLPGRTAEERGALQSDGLN